MSAVHLLETTGAPTPPLRMKMTLRDSTTAATTTREPEWCGALLSHGGDASPKVVAALRLFVHRAIQHGVGGRRGCNAEFIEDVTQEATLRILKNLHTFRGDSQFTTWATTVSLRVAFTELRHARWKDVSLDQALDQDQGQSGGRYEPAAAGESAERGQVREEIFAAMKRVMERELTDRQRVALEASLAGVPLHELAEKMQTMPNALYKLLHDARKRLKLGLMAAGVTEIDVRTALGASS